MKEFVRNIKARHIISILAAGGIVFAGVNFSSGEPLFNNGVQVSCSDLGSNVVFGPEIFSRSTAKPVIIRRNFNIPDSSFTFCIQVKNGENDNNLVSSAIIGLNGENIFSPQDFNQRIFGLSREINLRKENALEVELRSAPDSLLTITITTSGIFQPPNTWQSVGPMSIERAEHTSTLLNDGRVLVTGGFKGAGFTFSELSSAEIFNPNTSTFLSVGNMTTPRAFHTATLLPGGKVLIVGGTKDGGNTILNSAELFDPQTNTFTIVGNLNTKRFLHTADVLPDGKILIAGGHNGGISLKSTEIFDSLTNTFSLGPEMNAERWHHASTKLNDGRIVIINGLTINTAPTLEVFDPIANSFTLITSSLSQLGLGVVTLSNDKVFVSGSTQPNQTSGISAEIFDPSDNTFTEVGPMLSPFVNSCARQIAALLNDGRVLMVCNNLRAQVFNPQTILFKFTEDLNIPRLIRHRLTLLQDGRALLTGGQLSDTSFVTTNGAEVYKP